MSVPLGPLEEARGRRSPSTGSLGSALQQFQLCQAVWRCILTAQLLSLSWETAASFHTTEAGWKHDAEFAAYSANSKAQTAGLSLGPSSRCVCCKVVINFPAISVLTKASYSSCSSSPPTRSPSANFSVWSSISKIFCLPFSECMFRELE